MVSNNTMEKWSPYLTATNGSQKTKHSHHSHSQAVSKERKNINEQLYLMKIRINQLQKEEKKAKSRALNASTLTETIIERRIERKNKEIFREQMKKMKEKELNDLKERNKEMKLDIITKLAIKKEILLENKKISAKIIKDSLKQSKFDKSTEKDFKSTSSSPHHTNSKSRAQDSKLSMSKIEEDKQTELDSEQYSLKELKKLEELEAILISKLKKAYLTQKTAENKVAVLISNPIIASKSELEKLSSSPENNV